MLRALLQSVTSPSLITVEDFEIFTQSKIVESFDSMKVLSLSKVIFVTPTWLIKLVKK